MRALRFRSIFARFFASQSGFSSTYHSKLGPNESRLLYHLSNYRIQDARIMLDEMPQRNRHSQIVHWTSLLSKFAKIGFIDEARALFEIMPERNVVSYNAMLSSFVQSGRLDEARGLFEVMPERNVVSWTSMLSGLTGAGRIDEARRLFDEMPERNVVSWNAMLVGLIRNGDLEEARLVFDDVPEKNVVSWNTMIAGYAENGMMDEASVLFEEMDCGNVVTWTTMVSGYCRAGKVDEAYYLFCRMPERNLVSWTAMIGGFAWNGFYKEALMLFLEMEIKPNRETIISLVYACAGLGFPFLGKQLHAQVIISGWEFDDYDGRLSKSLIHMYSVLGIMDFARFIFSKDSNSAVVQSCNAMINGYIRIGELEEAEYLFNTAPIRDKISWTSMIDGYLSFGEVSNARFLFTNMPEKDAVAWTTMISGYVCNELFTEAIDMFVQMQAQGISPLSTTYSILFGAAGATANLDQGRQFHGMLLKTQDEFDLILENSLISMYGKCGAIDDAYRIFCNMVSKDVISWNSMIMGFSNHGLATEALRIFEAMLKVGTKPNSVTFLATLSACNHSGLVDKGLALFNSMFDVYGIQPSLEHHISIINLLGRAGKVKEAEEFVIRLPFEPDKAIWGALLGVCGFSEAGFEVAKRSAQELLRLDPLNAPAHVVMCNLYAAKGKYDVESVLRKEMGVKGVKKVPGCSWIQLNGRSHVFLSGDKLVPPADGILSLLYGVDEI